ncbi:hypothetical protein P153DRAFT_280044 [Dothidotthia symphoricarpi CBS 119687]|uniref:Rho-GAP domain-containing protein n=1 Tax=Dothidotthia symphoricarpi CBS 119687 TaxID=1392245 RepID=A0A6A6APM2_9PLEO|nr:uncharacterized protein P153DRAFT_280044 [Dothidotthia symphoricarpi CBS 119687]KAF2133942.1 hypothetical protein P153DRAFT_280044 [Dothidotthia symphoricarpi CBS 119687]
MPKPSTLSLAAMRSKGGKESANAPLSPISPRSPNEMDFATPNASFHSVPESPASPKTRKDSKNIFSNLSASKSSTRLINHGSSGRTKSSPTLYANSKSGSSTPELSRPVRTPNSDDNRSEIVQLSDLPMDSSKRSTAKPKQRGLLSRSKSIKCEESPGTRAKLNKAPPPQLSPASTTFTANGDGVPMKQAPLDKGQSWRPQLGPGKARTRSADRHVGSQNAEAMSVTSSSYNENKGPGLMSSIGSGARKMGEKMDNARKGMFGKLGRSSSNHETQSPASNEPYVYKIIHTPLVEQTRLTRISTRLEQSRDKTEFWMPALPWRCIDYLNMRGCEEEGLYRVPGSAQQIRYYERKFDQDRDIDLISDDNLNDPNVIGSLFKNWLRQLPDEIFPKATQARIQQECQGAKTTPQMLKDELSKLPPFNYYLLFAITCHISLLHSCSEFNKMNYNNLCICFQPAIRIDAFCFQFLILDWRNCWQGCWTEKEYLEAEMDFLSAMEAQRQQQISGHNNPPPSSGKNKPFQPPPQIGQAQKPVSVRSNSADQFKSSTRAPSADRNGRVTPPNPPLSSSETTNYTAPRLRGGGQAERESSTERTASSSDSRELQSRGIPLRPAPSTGAEASFKTEDGTTLTQAPHSRGPSDTQFRLDLSNPPSSPFNIKF